jgi:hypothetical protein
VNADERVHVERDDSQRVEPGLEDHGEDDVEEHRELKLWASRESGQRLSDWRCPDEMYGSLFKSYGSVTRDVDMYGSVIGAEECR